MTIESNQTMENILIVDDKPDNLRLLSNMLSSHGYKVRMAPNGKLALSGVQGMLPDLILLDIRMPGMDGFTVCEHLKRDELTRDIPVIFLSASDDTEDKVRAFALGGKDYITKPFQEQEILVRIKTHTALRTARNQLKAEQDLRESIINATSEGICVCYTTEEYPYIKFNLWNARMTEITGYTMEEINRMGWFQTMYPDSEIQKTVKQRMMEIQQGQQAQREEWEIIRKNGEKRILSVSTSTIKNELNITCSLVLMNDLTDKKISKKSLPAADELSKTKSAQAKSTPKPELQCHELNVCRCFKILVADDVEANIRLAKIRLEQQGHTVIEARNGLEAVEAYQHEQPDIILMDIHMPDMDGIEAAQVIRNMEIAHLDRLDSSINSDQAILPQIPIIALTASFTPDEQSCFLAAGINTVVGKPIDFDELYGIIEKSVPEHIGVKQYGQRLSQQYPAEQEKADYADSLQLEGINTKEGLKIWHDPAVYKKALIEFSQNYKSAADNIRSLLETGDTESAFAIVHALKGVAGNLSVTEVYGLAAALSDHIKDKTPAELMPLIEYLNTALNTVGNSLKQIIIEEDNRISVDKNLNQGFDVSVLQQIFRDLLNSYQEFTPAAAEPFLNLLAQTLSSQQLEPIYRQLNRFDFINARLETIKLVQELGIDIETG